MRRIVRGLDDPLTAPIMAYLMNIYAIDPAHVRSVKLISKVSDVQVIELELFVHVNLLAENQPRKPWRVCVDQDAQDAAAFDRGFMREHRRAVPDRVTGVPVCEHGDDAMACQLRHRVCGCDEE